MIHSIIAYIASGSTTNFNIPFSYESVTELEVTVDNVAPDHSVYSIVDNVVLFNTAPTTGAIVLIRRNTDISARDVVWQSGSILTEADLNAAEAQLFNKIQELVDDLGRCAKTTVTDSLNTNIILPHPEDGKILVWSGNSGTMINSSMNLLELIEYIDSSLVTMNDFKNLAIAAKDSAISSAGTSTQSAANSAASAVASAASAAAAVTEKTNAAASATNAAASAVTAGTGATTAGNQATIATTQAGIATTQAGISTTKAGEAATWMAMAQQQATNAAASAVSAETSAETATTKATEAAATAVTLSDTQAGINAIMGLGVGTANVDVDGNLIFTYNTGSITSLVIDATGSLILTY